MDHGEVSYESNYNSFNSILASEESEMMLQLFGSNSLDQNAQIQIQSLLNANSFLPPLSYEGFENVTPMANYYTSEEQNVMSYQLSADPDMQQTNQTLGSDFMGHENFGQSNGKRKLDACIYDENDETCKNASKRKSRPSLSRKRKNGAAKEVGNAESSSSSGSSEDESNSNGEINASDNSNGKSKNIRGTATDSQSLYARKRREKINLRLKTLQTLVPNGTKVDISTMLEEAVHYVNFLQLQIKLLSNDELWMYAPIAYNGMNVNLI